MGAADPPGGGVFARAALAWLPKILTLQDRNPHSPTFGCFDRNYWHYKIVDFPSGMAQEFAWPLALAWSLDLPENPFRGSESVRRWVEAGIRYAAASGHADGSCDDYFPHERAGGAAAFSLLACVESAAIVGLRDERVEAFFRRRADWLAGHRESGRLANHQALIALCLELLGRRCGTERWEGARRERLDLVLSWQSPEGWFAEYGGCDPGYLTLTISCLARLQALRPEPRLEAALRRAIALAAEFVHPDGSYGGECGSRNTYNFFPHGFELAGRWLPGALAVNDRYLAGLAAGRGPCHEDDHIIGHHAWNYLLAARDFAAERPAPAPRPAGRVVLREAGIVIDRRGETELYCATGKGGVFKLFRAGRLVASDTQLSLQVRRGRSLRNAVGHLAGEYEVLLEADGIAVAGPLGWAKQKLMTTASLLALRAVMLTVGRFFPDLVRALLQRLLITGRREAPFSFARSFRWEAGRWRVVDELAARSWEGVVAAGIGVDQTSTYVVMSRTFQAGQLLPWLDLTAEVRRLGAGERLRLERAP